MTDFVNIAGTTRQPQAVVLLDPSTGVPYAAGGGSGLTDAQLRASAVPVGATARTCLGTQLISALSSSTAASLTVPVGAVCADIQADGGVVRMRRDAGTPTATTGWRIDDGMSVTVDCALSGVRLLAQSGSTTNVQIAYFDRV